MTRCVTLCKIIRSWKLSNPKETDSHSVIIYDFKKNISGFSDVKNKGIRLWLLFPVCIDLFEFLACGTYCSYFNRFFVFFQGFLFWKWAKKYPVGLKPAGLLPRQTQDSLQMLWLVAYLMGFPPTGLYTLSWTPHGVSS